MASLTRVTVEESYKVYNEVSFTCPLEIAELYKTLKEDYDRDVDIEEVIKVSTYDRQYGIEEPGTYMIWDEEDGTKKFYKLEDYCRDDVDTAEWEMDDIAFEPAK